MMTHGVVLCEGRCGVDVRPRAGQHASFVYEAWANGRASASRGCGRARHGRGGASEDHRGQDEGLGAADGRHGQRLVMPTAADVDGIGDTISTWPQR